MAPPVRSLILANNFKKPIHIMATIKEIKPISLNKPILLEGFPGVGMVGTISVMYMVKELDMELCGYLSEKFPPFCTIHEGVPLPPARIYQSKKHNILAVISEFAIPLDVAHDVSTEIIKWAKSNGVRRIYSLGGASIKTKDSEEKVFGIATTEETRKLLEDNGIALIREGATTGVTGVLLAKAFIERIPVISLLAPTRGLGVDLISAAVIIDKFSQIERIPISTKKLIEEGAKIEKTLQKVLESAKEAHRDYKKFEEASGSMYR